MNNKIFCNSIFLAIVLKFVNSRALLGTSNGDDAKVAEALMNTLKQTLSRSPKGSDFLLDVDDLTNFLQKWNSRDLTNWYPKSNETKPNKRKIKSRDKIKSEENRSVSGSDRTRGFGPRNYYKPTLREKLFGPRYPYHEFDNPAHDVLSYIFNTIREVWESVCSLWDGPPHHTFRRRW